MVFRRKKRRLKAAVSDHKYCPTCGVQLQMHDSYCTRCGYSFVERHKKKKRKGIKWRNLLFFIIILVIVYVSIRYFNGESIIPTSLEDAFNFSIGNKTAG